MKVTRGEEFPDWASRAQVVEFLHEKMKPYQDEKHDIEGALDYALSEDPSKGGFVLLAKHEGTLVGSLVILRTAMGGYIPSNILLFVGVDPSLRGKGIGRQLIDMALASCDGAVKLHVERDNPAGRLYERLGFVDKYREMRLDR